MDELVKILLEAVEKHKYIEVGRGAAEQLGVKPKELNAALYILVRDHKNVVYHIRLTQAGTNFRTIVKVLTPPDTTYLELYKNRENIKMPKEG